MEGKVERNILKSPALLKYVMETNAYPREHEQLKKLREATIDKYPLESVMNISADEGQLLSMFLKVMNAKKTLELGVFTGYSLLATALALPPDGQITAVDINRETFEFGLPFIKKAGVEHKINFIQSDGVSVLKNLINDGKEGTYDFAFVDAYKDGYMEYHELLLKLVKVGGVIGYDNTLWCGTVALSENDEMKDFMRKDRAIIIKFNSFIARDPRIESSLISISDGVTLCRRLY